jgi:hypothetical protein
MHIQDMIGFDFVSHHEKKEMHVAGGQTGPFVQANAKFAHGFIDLGAALISGDLLRHSKQRFIINNLRAWHASNTSAEWAKVHDADGFFFQELVSRNDSHHIVGMYCR